MGWVMDTREFYLRTHLKQCLTLYSAHWIAMKFQFNFCFRNFCIIGLWVIWIIIYHVFVLMYTNVFQKQIIIFIINIDIVSNILFFFRFGWRISQREDCWIFLVQRKWMKLYFPRERLRRFRFQVKLIDDRRT